MHTSPRRLAAPFAFILGALVLGAVACGGSPTPEPRPLPKPPEPPVIDQRYVELPKPTAPPRWTAPSVTQTTLPSGLTLWHAGRSDAPLVSIQLVLPLGSAADPAGYEGLTALTADLLDEGAGKLSALELSDALDRLATDYAVQTGVDYVLVSMNALGENLDASLALLADIVQRPKLSKDEFTRRRDDHVAGVVARRANPDSRRAEALSHVLFANGYAGAPVRGTEESLGRIDLARVQAHQKKLTVPDGAHLVLAGAVEPAEAVRLTEAHFGTWKGKRTVVAPKLADALPAGRAYVVPFPGAAQSALSVATRAGAADDPLFFDELVMNQKVSETFTSRVNMNLREAKGYTYGAFGRFTRYKSAGYYAITSSVLTETTAKSVTEIFAELAALCANRPLSSVELRESTEGLLLGYPSQFASVEALGARVASLPIYGRPVDYFVTWPDRIAAVDLTRANRAAERYCDRSKYSVVVAGDLLAIGPELEKLGLPIVELDKNGLPTKSPE